jgi:hypothetical protein
LTHAWSFSLTPNADGGGAARPGVPFAIASSIALRLNSEAKSVPFWPFSGLNASSHTIDDTRSPICSSAPDDGQPP